MAAFKVVKWLDEGTSEPFFARLFVGLSELRDAALMARVLPANLEKVRLRFDDALEPVQEALISARKAMKSIATTVASHKQKVASGEIIQTAYLIYHKCFWTGPSAPANDYRSLHRQDNP